MQIKTTMRYHLTPAGMAMIKITMTERVWSKENPPTLLLGYKLLQAIYAGSMEVPQEIENRITL